MKTHIDTHPNAIAIVKLEGRLDFMSCVDAREKFSQAVKGGNRNLIVDLGDVSFIDSSGLGSLVGGLKTARQAGGDLRLARPTEQAASVLKLTSLDQVFRMHPSVEDALAVFQH